MENRCRGYCAVGNGWRYTVQPAPPYYGLMLPPKSLMVGEEKAAWAAYLVEQAKARTNSNWGFRSGTWKTGGASNTFLFDP